MTPEELDRRMEFIIEQQARFAAHIDQLRESDERLRESQATLTAAVLRIAEIVGELGEAQRRTEEQTKRTDERLNVLINVVERYISGGDGQKPRAS